MDSDSLSIRGEHWEGSGVRWVQGGSMRVGPEEYVRGSSDVREGEVGVR